MKIYSYVCIMLGIISYGLSTQANSELSKKQKKERSNIAISNSSDYSPEYLKEMEKRNDKPKESAEYKKHINIIECAFLILFF